MHLTPAMRTALRLGSRKGGVHVGNGRDSEGNPPPAKRVVKPVALKLVEAKLAVQHGDTLLTVQAGHTELAKPTPDEPVYLKERDGLTTRRELAVRDEPEWQDPHYIRPIHKDKAEAAQRDDGPRDRRRITAVKRAA